jgi:hypothetical protein
MKFSIETNFPQVQRQLETLRDDVAKAATARALNATVAIAKTAMSREIRQEYVLPASKVGDALRITKATAKGGLVSMEARLYPENKRGRSLNLAAFSARQTAKGVTFKIKRNGPRQLIPGAFLINDGKTVMIRVGNKRLPIKALQTIDVAQMFNAKRINAKVLGTIRERFPEIFAREAKFYTDRFNQRGKV